MVDRSATASLGGETVQHEETHKHEWGPIEHARFTGEPHRKCVCGFVSLDLDDDDGEDEVASQDIV